MIFTNFSGTRFILASLKNGSNIELLLQGEDRLEISYQIAVSHRALIIWQDRFIELIEQV